MAPSPIGDESCLVLLLGDPRLPEQAGSCTEFKGMEHGTWRSKASPRDAVLAPCERAVAYGL